MPTLVQLQCFAVLAEELNFRRAATRLNMTQPPLTRHIQALEGEVGATLLDRSRRSVGLTSAGMAFARSANRILASTADAVREARQIAGGDAGSLTIAFTATAGYAFLPNMIAAIRRRFPHLTLTLREMTTPQQLAALQAAQVDLCLLRPPASRPGILTRRVHRETMVLALPEEHALARSDAVPLSALSTETLVTYPPVEGPYLHGLVAGLLHAAGIAPRDTTFVTHTHSILPLVAAGLGVALVPEAAERIRTPGVVLRPVEAGGRAHVDLLMAWPDGSANPALKAVLGLVAGAAEPC